MKVVVRLRTAVLSAVALGSVLLTGCSSGEPTTATVAPSSSTSASPSTPAGTPSQSAGASGSAAPTPSQTPLTPDQLKQALAQAYATYVEPRPPANTPAITGAVGVKPKIAKPVGTEPTKMVVKDIVVGTGKEAPVNSSVTVDYLGIGWVDGKQFDTSFGKGAPSSFALSGLIPGWQIGIPGMKEGGRRELVIPAPLAYGQAGSGSPLAGKTLVFVIDLKKVG